jgi:hypothetical protein
MSGAAAMKLPRRTGRRPKRSASGPPSSVSHGPGEEEERQHEGPVRLAVAVLDLPQRDEREEAHVRHAPQADDHEQQDEAARLGLRRRRSLLAG